jgi:DNA-binding response OmpR family regulator
MTESIDVLLVEPCDTDARQSMSAIRRSRPGLSVVRVLAGNQAARLMFDHGLFTAAPQIPGLMIVDLPAAGEEAKQALQRLRSQRSGRAVPIVIFSARRTPRSILDGHLLGAHMNVQKPQDPAEFATAVERIMRMWGTGSFHIYEAEAS